MKKLLLKFLLLSLCVSVLFSLFSLTAFADGDEESQYVEWSFSTKDTLIRIDPDGVERTYYRVELPLGYYVSRNYYYFCDDPTEYSRMYCIFAGSPDSEIVYYEDEDGETVAYATDKGLNELSAFRDGLYEDAEAKLLMESDGLEVEISPELFDGLNALGGAVEKDVSLLKDAEFSRIIALDKYGSLTREIGVIWELEGELYYANLDKLPNNCFNSEGFLSYRSGSIPVCQVSPTLYEKITVAEDEMYYADYNIAYEDDGFIFEPSDITLTETQAKVILILVTAIIGIAAPLFPLIFSLRRLKSGRYDARAPMIVMAAGSSVWCAVGITLAILFLL